MANVKTLRQRTELPMKLCREALEQSGDSVDAAIAWLQENEEARAQCVPLAPLPPCATFTFSGSLHCYHIC